MFRLFLIVSLFSISISARTLDNMFPLAYVQQNTKLAVWNSEFSKKYPEAYADLVQFIESLPTTKYTGQSLAREMLKNPNTYKTKYRFLKFLQENAKERAKFSSNAQAIISVWAHVPEIYLQALIHMIDQSPVRDFYAPITQRLLEMQSKKEFTFVDMTESIRQSWAGLSNKLHVSTAANTMTKDSKGKYLVNGAYNTNTKVFALDLSLSRDENLITFAHEIVHIADPELIAANENLKTHFTKLTVKLRALFPSGDIEGFLNSLIRHTFMEQGRIDLASLKFKSLPLTSEIVGNSVDKVADSIKAAGYDYLLEDEDFKGFIQNLIRVSVENEYKAYVLSYALYSALKDENSSLIPPSKKRDEFIREHFDHPSRLQDILKSEAEPFKRGDPVLSLLPRLEGMTPDQIKSAEESIQKTVSLTNIVKDLVLHLYFEASKQMIERTTKEFSPLYKLINRVNFPQTTSTDELTADSTVSGAIASASSQIIASDRLYPRTNTEPEPVKAAASTNSSDDEDFYEEFPWIKPGGYNNSVTNPFLLAEETMGTKSISDFLKNVEGLATSLNTMHEALLTMMAGILPLNNLNFGELKWIGLMNVGADPYRSMPPQGPGQCSAADLQDMHKHDPEMTALFSRFVYNKENDLSSQYIQYDAARTQVYLMQLYKAVHWLRKEFPITRRNFKTLKDYRRKLTRGDYERAEISEDRAKELIEQIDGYLKVTTPRQNDLIHIEHLMRTLMVIENAARKVNMFGLASEFQDRMDTARRFFSSLGMRATVGPAEAEQLVTASVQQLRTEIRSSKFAVGCSMRDDFDFNRAEKYVFNFGPGRKVQDLTLYCFNRQLYVLRLPCKWTSGATTSTTDPAGFNTKIFIDGRKLLMAPFMDLRPQQK